MRSGSEIFNVLNHLFERLDNAPITPEGMFSSEDKKERYETAFMYSFRKHQAACYHYENVQRFIEEARIKAQKLEGLKNTNIVMEVARTAEHYAYELSAFLEALKSSIDFLAIACSPYLTGIEIRSISTLMRLVQKKRKGPIFDEIIRNLDWIESLRSYRHHVVHRRIISTSNGYEKINLGGITKTIIHPIIIPKSPPPYVPDTRKIRAYEASVGLDYFWSELRANSDDGSDLVQNYNKADNLSHDFVVIEEFMKKHLNSFKGFFTGIISTISDLDFKPISNK